MTLTMAKDSAATTAVGTMIHALRRTSARQSWLRSRSPRGAERSGAGAGDALGCGGTGAACAGATLALSDCQNLGRIVRSKGTQPLNRSRRITVDYGCCHVNFAPCGRLFAHGAPSRVMLC